MMFLFLLLRKWNVFLKHKSNCLRPHLPQGRYSSSRFFEFLHFACITPNIYFYFFGKKTFLENKIWEGVDTHTMAPPQSWRRQHLKSSFFTSSPWWLYKKLLINVALSIDFLPKVVPKHTELSIIRSRLDSTLSRFLQWLLWVWIWYCVNIMILISFG